MCRSSLRLDQSFASGKMNSFVLILLQFNFVVSSDILKLSIEEKLPMNTIVLDLVEKFRIRSMASYSLVELLPINAHLFTVDNRTGHLMTSSMLDREQLCFRQQCSCDSCTIVYHLIVHNHPRVLEKIIEIHIEDRNDHSPSFEQESIRHQIHIKDNVPLGHRIVLPSASDPDEGINTVQTYRLEGNDDEHFDVDFSSMNIPYLIVKTSLDRQRSSSYSLKLIASDRAVQHSTSLDLQIRITNESIPIFQQSVYSVDIREDLPIGSTILRVEATSERGQIIFYELITDSPFIIDRLTGQISLKKLLDYEREKSFRLTIKAHENSVPTYAIVLIRLIDVNDNPVSINIRPQANAILKKIRYDQHVISVPEDLPLGTTIAHVFLNDLDSFANGNPYLQIISNQPPSPFIYKLIYQNSFQNTKIYSLILHTALDRENKSFYDQLQILAHDTGTPSLQTRLSLVLNVTDVNDCVPKIISSSTTFNINENNPLGLILGTLEGSDGDVGINGQYEYRIENVTDLLLIEAQTGRLILNQSIDFEQYQFDKYQTTIDLEFSIGIRDFGQPSLSSESKIILRIHDLNDNAPIFDGNQSYQWQFSKSTLIKDAVLGRVHAHDHDSGVQGFVHYTIQSSDLCFPLNITSLGHVYLLDDVQCLPSSYDFEITAHDYGTPHSRSTKQILTVTILPDQTSSIRLPKRIPTAIPRTQIDLKSLTDMIFLIDMTDYHWIEPKIILNNTELSNLWIVSRTGEVRLINQPQLQSYTLIFYITDEFTQEIRLMKLQVDLCNSSTIQSCRKASEDEQQSNNQILVFWAMILAVIVTILCITIVSVVTCLCCRRRPKPARPLTKVSNFLQCHDSSQSEKTLQSSSGSTIRDDDHDSGCAITTNSSYESQTQQKETNSDIYQPSTYFYDLKLAELMRHNQHPPCVHLNSQICQSLSTDYGFISSDPPSSCASSLNLTVPEPKNTQLPVRSSPWTIDQREQKKSDTITQKNSFVSTCEYVV